MYVITAGNDSTIVVSTIGNIYGDLTTIKRISGHIGSIIGLDSYNFNNNCGTIFVSIGGDKTVRHWSMIDVLETRSSTGSSVPHVTFSNHAPFTCVKYSSDGRFVGASDDSGHVTIYQSEIPSLRIPASIIEKRDFKFGPIQSLNWDVCNRALFLGLANGTIAKVNLPVKYHRQVS
jgi:WD40 repeat protein